jgi:hypothetical protein
MNGRAMVNPSKLTPIVCDDPSHPQLRAAVSVGNKVHIDIQGLSILDHLHFRDHPRFPSLTN